MARSQRRWPMPESRTMVRMSISTKPFSRVGVPRQSEARSRWDRIVSMTIWQASRRSERVFRCGCDWSALHFFGWKYHAFARSAASERMRGNPPLPFLMDLAGERVGFFGSWPQRFPVIFLPRRGRNPVRARNTLEKRSRCRALNRL